MGAKNARPNIDQAEYEAEFKATSQDCQNGPKEDRGCQDLCCLITFIIFTLIFVIAGIYFMSTMKTQNFQTFKDSLASKSTSNTPNHDLFLTQPIHLQSTTTTPQSRPFPSLTGAIPYICLMGIFSLILSIVLVIAISKIPKIVIYGTIAITFILIVVGIIAGLVTGVVALAIACAVFGLVWGILVAVMFCCWKDQFQAAIVLLKVTGNFLKSKPTVLLAPVFTMFVSSFYFIFWVVSFVAIQLSRAPESASAGSRQINSYDIFSIIWVFFSLFYSYFFYYVMVFLIATATAMWYFNIDGNYLLKGLSHIWKSHIGSLTFASLIVTIVGMLKSAANNNNDGEQNACAMVCMCLVRCCLQFLEDLIKTLNHNAVIVMSVKGQGFIDSAKTAIYLIFNYFGIFMSVEMVEFLLNMCVIFLTVVTPTALGFLMLKLTYNQASADEGVYLFAATLAIFIICVTISLLTIKILSQILSCVFIFYCLNQQFRRLNYGSVNRVPQDLQGLFSEIVSQSSNELNNSSNEPAHNGYNQVPPANQNYNNYNQASNQQPKGFNPYNKPYNS